MLAARRTAHSGLGRVYNHITAAVVMGVGVRFDSLSDWPHRQASQVGQEAGFEIFAGLAGWGRTARVTPCHGMHVE